MANIDLLELEPTTISRDLRGKFVLLYGQAKVGKTTLQSSFPKNLFLSTEQGTNALPSAYVVNIDTWSTFKGLFRQLRKEDVKEKFHTLTIDTISILFDLCEKYICAQHGVETIGQIPYGGGYAALSKEFSESMRQITLMGYGLVLIAHNEIGVRKNPYTGEDEEFVRPQLNKRAYAIANRLVDAIIYLDNHFDEEGKSVRRMITRETPTIFAGSRFRFLAPVIDDSSYEGLANALYEAIDMEGKLGATVVNTPDDKGPVMRPFSEAMKEAEEVWAKLLSEDQENNINQMIAIIEQVFGSPIKLSTVTENQQELLELVISEFKNLLK